MATTRKSRSRLRKREINDNGSDIIIYDDPFEIPEGLSDQYDEQDIERTEYEIYDKNPTKSKVIQIDPPPKIVEIDPSEEVVYNPVMEKPEYIVEEIDDNNKKTKTIYNKRRPQETVVYTDSEDDIGKHNKTYYLKRLPNEKQKTIVVQDNRGREVTRLVSAVNDKPEYIEFQQQRPQMVPMMPTVHPYSAEYTFSAVPMETMIAPVSMPVPVPVPVTPMVQPQSQVVPMIMVEEQPTKKIAIIEDVIPEEDDDYEIPVPRPKTYKHQTARSNNVKQKLLPDPLEDETTYLYWCSYCDEARTDVCSWCWKSFICPTWLPVAIGVAIGLAIIAVVVIYALAQTKII